MVVDDEWAIVGSANINDRSMDGDRDSEMCFGAYQPACLWGEHLNIGRGQSVDPIVRPETGECVRFVNERAERSSSIQHLQPLPCAQDCHLMMHPTGLRAAAAA
eukprot:gene1395-31151_t